MNLIERIKLKLWERKNKPYRYTYGMFNGRAGLPDTPTPSAPTVTLAKPEPMPGPANGGTKGPRHSAQRPSVGRNGPPTKRRKRIWDFAYITQEEFEELMAFRANREARNYFLTYLVGVLLTPISLAGALMGYARAYNRFYQPQNRYSVMWPMSSLTRFAMITGAVILWAIVISAVLLSIPIFRADSFWKGFIIAYLTANTFISAFIFGIFRFWQYRVNRLIIDSYKYGSARFASEFEMQTLRNKEGYYLGNRHLFDDKGHILTVAGTRGGKGTNIILPNLLGASNMRTSWVVIDPKAENAYISANYQRSIGQDVAVLNPWGLFEDKLGEAQTYNPLDMLQVDSVHLVDDIQMIAEMIVPIDPNEHDKFWTDSARTVVAGLLLHLMTSQPIDKQNLATLWEWARLGGEDWNKLIQDMGASTAPVNDRIVKNAANEILKLQEAGDETFGSIIANVLQSTDFLKSPALQRSLQSGFDPEQLTEGKTTLYVIIPADKLRSHSRWLRLVVTSMMRSVVRKPGERVTFLLDEFAALGYLPEIETALSTYAGYKLTVWPILQSLIQLKSLYKENWESFVANCTVRQYFSINDNFSAEYVSTAIGETSNVTTKKDGAENETNRRRLKTPDEVRRESGKRIFMFIADLPPTVVDKVPYYTVEELSNRANKNPYI